MVYELYSILIHDGSAYGGHYYAFIKSFEDQKWYKFNDTQITEINVSIISSSFGGNKTSGYMLFYKEVDE